MIAGEESELMIVGEFDAVLNFGWEIDWLAEMRDEKRGDEASVLTVAAIVVIIAGEEARFECLTIGELERNRREEQLPWKSERYMI